MLGPQPGTRGFPPGMRRRTSRKPQRRHGLRRSVRGRERRGFGPRCVPFPRCRCRPTAPPSSTEAGGRAGPRRGTCDRSAGTKPACGIAGSNLTPSGGAPTSESSLANAPPVLSLRARVEGRSAPCRSRSRRRRPPSAPTGRPFRNQGVQFARQQTHAHEQPLSCCGCPVPLLLALLAPAAGWCGPPGQGPC